MDFPSDKGFIKVNVEQSGFYRVNYDLSNWHDIISHLHSNPKSEVHCVHYLCIYRRSGFNCEYLLNANCEDFKTSQLIDSQK